MIRSIPLALAAAATLAACVETDDEPVLTGDAWTVEDIAGAGVIDNSMPQLLFMEDGALGGQTGCNSILGQWTQDGGTLILEELGSTKALCPETLMNQETRMIEALTDVTAARVDETGALILSGPEGDTILSRR